MKFSLRGQKVVCRGDYWIAPNATVVGSVILENNASVWFNCVVRGDNDVIVIGENSHLQDGCVVHVDPGYPVTLGRNVSVGHMAMLHGCTIGDGTLIGIKAVVLNGARIGRNCLIGAGALVTEAKEIPDGTLVTGMPGKVIRQLSADEIKFINEASEDYVQKFRRYKAEFQADPTQDRETK